MSMLLRIGIVLSIVSTFSSVLCDTITWGMRDLKTKTELCDKGRCDLKYGQVVYVYVIWTFEGEDWVQPQVNFVDFQYAFLNNAKIARQTYYVCPHGNDYQTSLIACNFTAKAGTYKFGFSLTALTSTQAEFISKTEVYMNADSPRSTSAPVNVVHIKK